MLVAVIIGAMIAIVVGVSLVPVITETVEKTAEEGAVSPTVSTLIGILPYIFVIVILLGAVAWISGVVGGSQEEREERRKRVSTFFKNPREVILRIEKSSGVWERYINNLDNLLGIKTRIADQSYEYLSAVKIESDGSYSTPQGLYLEGSALWIDKGYDWYIADKYPDQDIFKVVGLHKKDASKNKVYILGLKEGTQDVFLKEVPNNELETSCKHSCDLLMAKV